jgi:hypothetical protein
VHRDTGSSSTPSNVESLVGCANDGPGLNGISPPTRRSVQLGAGPHGLPGWLNADLTPLNDSAIYVDVAKRFPFDD